MNDHLMTETDLTERCYCGKVFQGKSWTSENVSEGDVHYKKTICDCGCTIHVKVNFRGSGHDSWDGTNNWQTPTTTPEIKITTIENIVSQLKK